MAARNDCQRPWLLLVLGLFVISPVHAIVVDFETLPIGSFSGETSESGYTISHEGVSPASALAAIVGGGPTNCGPPCASNTTNSLGGFNASAFVVTSDAGTPFSLFAFDAAETFSGEPTTWADTVVVVGELFGGGQIMLGFALDGINDAFGGQDDFQPFLLPSTFADLTSVRFVGDGGFSPLNNGFMLDNLGLSVNFLAAAKSCSGSPWME